MIVLSAYVLSEQTKIFCTWELNKSFNIHFHMLVSDPFIINDMTLNIYRRDILNNPHVIKNLSTKMIDYMNNIVFVNDSINNRFVYMIKDLFQAISLWELGMKYFQIMPLPQ